jgi:hypothetical protein
MGRRFAALSVAVACAGAGLLGVSAASASAALSGSPVGAFFETSARFDDVAILSGNAYDPDASAQPLTVRFYAGATFVGATTTVPPAGGSSPFEWSIGSNQLVGPLSYDATVCAYAINVGPGSNALLGCRRIRPVGGSDRNPRGSLDAAIASPGLVQLKGWAGDPDGDRTTQLRVYYDGKLVAQKTANLARSDVQRVIPAVGPTTGFNVALPIAPGAHQICVYAQNTGPAGNANATVGCVSRSVPGVRPAGPHDPRGSYDAIGDDSGSAFPNTVHHAAGWAFDPDSSGPVTVRIRTLMYRYFVAAPYLHQNKTLRTHLARPDVAAAVPGAGPSTGFQGVVASGSFSYVRLSCAYVENLGPGSDRFVGCAKEIVPSIVAQY